MIFINRPWLALLAAGCLFSASAGGQQDNAAGGATQGAGAGGAAAGSPAAAPAAGSPAAGGASSQFGAAPAAPSAPANPNAPNQGALPQGTQNPNAPNQPNQGPQGAGTTPGQPGTEGQDNTGAGGSASAFGSAGGAGGSQLQQAPASFTVPGFYGRGAETFTMGEGRLARPHFRIFGNMSVGYDDNVFTTPTHALAIPNQKVQVPVSQGSPASQTEVLIPSGDPNVPSTMQAVQTPPVAPQFHTVEIKGIPAAQRIPSWITRTDAKLDMQFANRKTLFTFDIGGGLDYYWDRPGKKEDYTGSMSIIYLRKLSGRAQFTFSMDASYQSQPDFSQPNVPTSPLVGSYLTANAKADLSYRLTPRFTAVASVTYNSLEYTESGQTNGNYETTILGTELRYLIGPRLTVVGEVRGSEDKHPNDPLLDTTNYYALLGADVQLSRRFTGTVRAGEQVQTFTEGGNRQSAPYGELSLGYRFTPQTTLAMNARYGYEEAGEPDTRDLVARTGITLSQIFTPRLQAVLSVNLVKSSVTSTPNATTTTGTTSSTTSTGSSSSSTTGSSTSGTAASSSSSSSTGSTANSSSTNSSSSSASSNTSTSSNNSISTKQVTDTIDTTLGFYYTLNRHWSLNLTYTYTTSLGPIPTDDYFRQRIFFGGSYQF